MPRPGSKPSRGRSKATAFSPRENKLLKLALELRENIYIHVLRMSSSSLFNLLFVNRQMLREVTPFIFKRPLTFDGQSELFGWLDRTDPQYLRHVVDVRFKLHDIDPDKIVGALGKRLQQANITRASGSRGPDTRDNPYYEACRLDLARIESSFRLLPNIRKLTILACTDRDPQPREYNPERLLPRRYRTKLQDNLLI